MGIGSILGDSAARQAWLWETPLLASGETYPLEMSVFLSDEGAGFLLGPVVESLEETIHQTVSGWPGSGFLVPEDLKLTVQSIAFRRPAAAEDDGRRVHVWMRIEGRSAEREAARRTTRPLLFVEVDLSLVLEHQAGRSVLRTSATETSIRDMGAPDWGLNAEWLERIGLQRRLERHLRTPIQVVDFTHFFGPELALKWVAVDLEPEREDLVRIELLAPDHRLSSRQEASVPATKPSFATVVVSLQHAAFLGDLALREISAARGGPRVRLFGFRAEGSTVELYTIGMRTRFPRATMGAEIYLEVGTDEHMSKPRVDIVMVHLMHRSVLPLLRLLPSPERIADDVDALLHTPLPLRVLERPGEAASAHLTLEGVLVQENTLHVSLGSAWSDTP